MPALAAGNKAVTTSWSGWRQLSARSLRASWVTSWSTALTAGLALERTVPPMGASATLFNLPEPDPDPVVLAYPAGPVLRTFQGSWGLATATFDATGAYRFRLSRIWDETRPKRACWIMLNPSTATEQHTDPTVERTLRFARAWGCGSSEVVNVFAYRATDPSKLKQVADPVGPGNDDAIVAAAQAADIVIAAWGVHAKLGGRDGAVLNLLAAADVKLHRLRLTKDGHPGHPLYMPGNLPPTVWS